MRSLPLKLSPGSDLRLSLQELAQSEGASGFVLGVVGNLSRVAFQCPGQKEPHILVGNLEIITLNGTISPEEVHLHLSISDGDCQVWGGHLEPGTIVLKGADVLIGLLGPVASESQAPRPQNPKDERIEIFVIPNCPWSARALRILKSSGISHKVQVINEDFSFNALNQRSNNSTFPQVFIDGSFVGGYDSLEELIRSGQLDNFK